MNLTIPYEIYTYSTKIELINFEFVFFNSFILKWVRFTNMQTQNSKSIWNWLNVLNFSLFSIYILHEFKLQKTQMYSETLSKWTFKYLMFFLLFSRWPKNVKSISLIFKYGWSIFCIIIIDVFKPPVSMDISKTKWYHQKKTKHHTNWPKNHL